MVKKIAGEAGLQPEGDVDQRRPRVLPAEQRDRLGLRLAARADARLRGRRRRHARSSSARPTRPTAPPVALTWQDTLISFRPRMSGVQQPKTVNVRALGPEGQEGRQRHRRPARTTTSQAGVTRATGLQRPRRRHDRGHRPRRGQQRRGQRDRQVDAATGWPTRSSRPTASPSATPRSRPARKVKVAGVGTKFGGTFTVTSLDAHLPRRDRLPDALPDLRPLARARCSS